MTEQPSAEPTNPMKTFLCLFTMCSLIAFFSGCTTTEKVTTNPDGTTVTNVVKSIDTVKVGYAAEDAAAIGTTAALIYNPNFRPAFKIAVDALAQLEDKDKISLDEVKAVLLKLPIKELKSSNAQIGIALGDQVFVMLDRDKLSLNRNEAVKAFSHGIYVGMKRALGE